MSFRNTIIVVVLLILIGGYALYERYQPPPETTPKLYKVDAKNIEQIEMRTTEHDVAIARTKDGTWQIVKPIVADADQETADEIANNIAGLEITSTAEAHPTDLAPFGLAVPEVTVTVTTKDHKTLPAILVGKQAPIGNSGFIKRADQPAVLMVSSVFATQVNKQLNDLRSRMVFKQKPPDANKIVIAQGKRTIELERTGGNWKITEPRDYPADKDAVTAMLSTLNNARVTEFFSDALDPSKYGLSEPALKVTLYSPDQKPPETLRFGFKQPTAGSNAIYAQSGDPKTSPVFTLTEDVFAAVNKSFDDLRDKTVMRFDPSKVARVVFKGGPYDETLVHGSGDKWTITANGKTAAAELPVAQSLVDQLHELKANRIVEDPMSDPSHYGMVKPTVTIAVMDKQGQSLGQLRASLLQVTVTPHNSDQKAETKNFGYATTSLDQAVYEIPAQAVTDFENTGNRLHSDAVPSPAATPGAKKAAHPAAAVSP